MTRIWQLQMISCETLTRHFGAIHAVDGLTFSVPQGKVFALLGANGAGKTTTIHLLLGILKPTAGRATVCGLDPHSDGDQVRSRTGVLLEHHGLYERLSGEDNLDFHGRIARMPDAARASRHREPPEDVGLRWRQQQ